jgi:four helix bundle protein
MPKNTKFDLEERTQKFGEDVIVFVKTLSLTPITTPIVNQLVRSATSVGANYMEADAAESKKDFIHKIGICKKEAKETCHWLRMVACVIAEQKEKCRVLWKEAHELVLIFSAINRRKE